MCGQERAALGEIVEPPSMPAQSSDMSENPVLRILHLEDNPADAQLLQAMLKSQGVVCTIKPVETRQAFEAALEQEPVDLIISDFTLPTFDGVSALILTRQRKPELPFIFLSGTLAKKPPWNRSVTEPRITF